MSFLYIEWFISYIMDMTILMKTIFAPNKVILTRRTLNDERGGALTIKHTFWNKLDHIFHRQIAYIQTQLTLNWIGIFCDVAFKCKQLPRSSFVMEAWRKRLCIKYVNLLTRHHAWELPFIKQSYWNEVFKLPCSPTSGYL